MARAPTDWQLGCVELKQRGEYLLKSGQWSDCTFLVGAEPDQVVIAGHKLVLAMASPVFEAMFYGAMAESNDPIPILDVQPEAFRALLEYIYTDNVNISSFDIVCQLYYAAKKYMLPHLVQECSRCLWSNPKPRNVCRAYEFARLFDENVHMDKCIQIISTNTKEVLTDSSFEDVDLNTVITVFSLDHLNVDSELDLFEAAVRYAKAQDKRTSERSVSPPSGNGTPNENRIKSPGSSTSKDKEVNVEGSAQNSPEAVMATQKASDSSEQPLPAPSGEGNNKPDPKSDQPTIRSVIEKIRFLSLTPQQFAKGPARSSLLTESEAFAVLMNITSSSSDVAMPSGFSTCREPRERLIRIVPSSNLTDATAKNRSGAAQRLNGAPQTKEWPFKLVLLGGLAVGKSSLMLRFVKGQFHEYQECTIGVATLKQTICLDDTTVKFEITDTAGPERYHSLAPMYYRGAQAAIVVYDITNQDTFECAKNWVQELQREASPFMVIALAGNKSDLAARRMVEFGEAQAYADRNGLLFMETSAKAVMNVNDIFLAIANKLLQSDGSGAAGGARRLGNAEQARQSSCCIS